MIPEATLSKLTAKQYLALPLFLSGMSSLEISKQVGVKASTVSEWLNNSDAFKQAVLAARAETITHTSDAINSLVLRSLHELGRIISSSSSDATRLKACELVLSKLLLPAGETVPPVSPVNGSINLALIMKGLGYD